MNAIAFDTLKFARRLRDGGFTDAQAESVADALGESCSGGDLATKSDMVSLRADVKADFAGLRGELRAGLADVKAEIIKWMFDAMLAQGALVVTLVKLIPGK